MNLQIKINLDQWTPQQVFQTFDPPVSTHKYTPQDNNTIHYKQIISGSILYSIWLNHCQISHPHPNMISLEQLLPYILTRDLLIKNKIITVPTQIIILPSIYQNSGQMSILADPYNPTTFTFPTQKANRSSHPQGIFSHPRLPKNKTANVTTLKKNHINTTVSSDTSPKKIEQAEELWWVPPPIYNIHNNP